MDSIYGNYRQKKFTDVFGNFSDFREFYNSSGISPTISSKNLETLYYLLYARYGNSTIASSDTNQFKYKLFGIIFCYGPTWEKRLGIQIKLRELTIDELMKGSTQINNQAFHPGSAPSTQTTEELEAINAQHVTKYKKDKLSAYAHLMELLETDVTNEFLERFKKLFLVVVSPELPLWYETEINEEVIK